MFKKNGYEVVPEFKWVEYSENGKTIHIDVEPGVGVPSLVNLPGSERWQKEMPDWAKNRREEIIERIKAKCDHLDWEWKEY